MKSAKLWVAGLVLGLLAACGGPTAEQVRTAISDSTACEAVEECVDLGSHCPFGCQVVVHEDYAEDIQAMMDDYYATTQEVCAAACAESSGIDCLEGTCTALYE